MALLLLAADDAFAFVKADSLHIEVYRNMEDIDADKLPDVFPRHRGFSFLLHCSGEIKTKATMLQIADTLAALRKLTGLKYYSVSDKKMNVLFKESSLLPYPSARKSAPDPAFTSLPIDTSYYFYQIDNRIGKVIYKVDLHATRDELTYLTTNVSPVQKFGLQLAAVGDALLFVKIMRESGKVRYEAWQWTKYQPGVVTFLVKQESFVNRFRALVGKYVSAFGEKQK